MRRLAATERPKGRAATETQPNSAAAPALGPRHLPLPAYGGTHTPPRRGAAAPALLSRRPRPHKLQTRRCFRHKQQAPRPLASASLFVVGGRAMRRPLVVVTFTEGTGNPKDRKHARATPPPPGSNKTRKMGGSVGCFRFSTLPLGFLSVGDPKPIGRR